MLSSHDASEMIPSTGNNSSKNAKLDEIMNDFFTLLIKKIDPKDVAKIALVSKQFKGLIEKEVNKAWSLIEQEKDLENNPVTEFILSKIFQDNELQTKFEGLIEKEVNKVLDLIEQAQDLQNNAATKFTLSKIFQDNELQTKFEDSLEKYLYSPNFGMKFKVPYSIWKNNILNNVKRIQQFNSFDLKDVYEKALTYENHYDEGIKFILYSAIKGNTNDICYFISKPDIFNEYQMRFIEEYDLNYLKIDYTKPWSVIIAYWHLKDAIIKGDIEKIIKLMNKGVHLDNKLIDLCPDNKVKLELQNIYEIHTKFIEYVKSTIDAKCDLDPEEIKKFIEQGVQINTLFGKNNGLFQSALHYAARHSSKKNIALLIEMGADRNIQDNDGSLPLHLAAILGNLDSVEYLLNMGNQVNFQNIYEMSALNYAAANGYTQLVRFLIDKGAKHDLKSNNNSSPMMLASRNGHLDTVKFFIEEANLAKQDDYISMLWNAVLNDKIDIVKYLFSKGVTPKNEQFKSRISGAFLETAAEKGHTEIFKLLFDELDDQTIINYENNYNYRTNKTALHSAIEKNNIEIVRIYINRFKKDVLNWVFKHHVNHEKMRPLHVAAEKGHAAIIELLLDQLDPNEISILNEKDYPGYTALHFAVEKGHIEIVKMLVSKGANLDSYNNKSYSPISYAYLYDHDEIVTYLLDQGATLSKIAASEALVMVADRGDIDKVRFLHSKGALLDYKSKMLFGKSAPLHRAVMHNCLEIVKYLLENGADPNIKDRNGRRPMNFACYKNNLDIFKLLLEKGGDLDLKTKSDSTFLHSAIGHNSTEIIRFLIENKADIYMNNEDNMTPLEFGLIYCKKDASESIKLLLEQYTAKDIEYLRGLLPKIENFYDEDKKAKYKELLTNRINELGNYQSENPQSWRGESSISSDSLSYSDELRRALDTLVDFKEDGEKNINSLSK